MEPLKHECGLAVVRLLKPLSYYQNHYGAALWGLHRLYLLMDRQHNRGQDGAGVACVKLDMPSGEPYLFRDRVLEPAPPWQTLIRRLEGELGRLRTAHPDRCDDADFLKQHFPFAGEVLLGHLRYGTYGLNTLESCHPGLRSSNWRSRTLLLAGNFNLTNVEEQFRRLVALGQHPVHKTDTVTMLERVGHFLDEANLALIDALKTQGCDEADLGPLVEAQLDVLEMLRRSAKHWDGGFVMAGLMGHGDLFVARDPWGIRPAFYYQCADYVAVASERPALAAAFGLEPEVISEVPPAHALVVKAGGAVHLAPFAEAGERRSCSFERIYFSRGNDPDIYRERKALGRALTPQVLAAIDDDVEHAVFAYVPNTAVLAYRGLLEGLRDWHDARKVEAIAALGPSPSFDAIRGIMARRIRAEQVVLKDTALRTFITDDVNRNAMAANVYDITYGAVRAEADHLVCLDDSIVRGTTLRESLLRILARLRPRSIVIVSSAPQIRYPDCYGIDMSRLEAFIAFKAAVALLHEHGLAHVLDETQRRCTAAREQGELEAENYVTAIYAPFTDEEVSAKIAALLAPEDLPCPLKVLFQTIEGLRASIPAHTGDWYFTGRYPTPGGNRVVNQAFLNYYEGRAGRAYD